MLETTRALRHEILNSESPEGKVACLKGACEGQTAILLSCGPSLNALSPDELRELCKGRLVIAVKQAYDQVPGLADFHIFNWVNLQLYRYPQEHPVVLFSYLQKLWKSHLASLKIDFDIGMPYCERAISAHEMLLTRRNYDEYLFEKSLRRPWGPGVVFEVAVYLAVQLQVKQLIAFGVDSWPSDFGTETEVMHFYDRQNLLRRFKIVFKNCGVRIPYRGAFFLIHKYRFRRGGRLFGGMLVDGEARAINEGSASLYRWLRQQGVELMLASDQSYLDECIPRVSPQLGG